MDDGVLVRRVRYCVCGRGEIELLRVFLMGMLCFGDVGGMVGGKGKVSVVGRLELLLCRHLVRIRGACILVKYDTSSNEVSNSSIVDQSQSPVFYISERVEQRTPSCNRVKRCFHSPAMQFLSISYIACFHSTAPLLPRVTTSSITIRQTCLSRTLSNDRALMRADPKQLQQPTNACNIISPTPKPFTE